MKQEQASMYDEISTILRNSNDLQCFGGLCGYSLSKRQWKFCAIGTIYHHYQEKEWQVLFEPMGQQKIFDKIGIKKPPTMSCPVCGARCAFLGLVIHLNDRHHKTYGEIADYIDKAKPYDSSNSLFRKIIDSLKNF